MPDYTNNLTAALDFVRKFGLPVFPVRIEETEYTDREGKAQRRDVKSPLLKNPYGKASTDEAQIRRWFEIDHLFDGCAFAAFPGAGGYAVVDLDTHGGKDGKETLLAWAKEQRINIPGTLTVRTPSGGLHLWFRDDKLTGGRNGWLNGVDVHGGKGAAGAYVLIPGQATVKGAYTVEFAGPMAQLPAEIVESVNAARSKKDRPADGTGANGTPAEWSDMSLILDEVRSMKPIECGRRDNTLIALCLDWKERGVDRAGMLALLHMMDELGKIEAGDDPLTDADFNRLSGSAWKKADTKFGSRTLDALFRANSADLASGGYDASELAKMDIPEPEFLVDGLLPAGLTILGGAAKAGKSYLCLQLAVSLVTGEPFLGHEVKEKRRVLYLALESDPGQIKKRLSNLYGEDFKLPKGLVIVHKMPPLTAGGLAQLRKLLAEHKPDIVIIDVWQKVRALDARKGGSAYQREYLEISTLRDTLINEEGVSVILTHHLKQLSARDKLDPLDTLNGSSAISGSANCVWLLVRDRGAEDAFLEVHGWGQEDGRIDLVKMEPMGWRLAPVSGAAHPVAATEFQRQILDVLNDCPDGLKAAEIASRIPGAKYEAVYRQLTRWADTGQIDRVNRRFRRFNYTEVFSGEDTDAKNEQ